jgi:hypothetical protein
MLRRVVQAPKPVSRDAVRGPPGDDPRDGDRLLRRGYARGPGKQIGALIVAAFSYSDALAASRGTSNALILNSSSEIPLHTVLAFSNLTEVEDYFGMASPEAAEAATFFGSPPTSKNQLMYARFHLDGGRARVFGAPTFNTRTLSEIEGIRGTLSFASQGYSWGPVTIDLSGVAASCAGVPPNDCHDQAASVLQTEINAARPALATAIGSIAPHMSTYVGSIMGGVLNVTSLTSGTVQIGGRLTSTSGYSGIIVGQIAGAPGGVGQYACWYGWGFPPYDIAAAPGSSLTETYGVLTITSVSSGGPIVPGLNLSGRGAYGYVYQQTGGAPGGAGTYVIQQALSVGPEAITLKATPMTVTYHTVKGAKANRGALWLAQNGASPPNTSSMTYVGGTAAAALGWTQASGAILSTPGGTLANINAYMNSLAGLAAFTDIYTDSDTDPTTASALASWTASNLAYRYRGQFPRNQPLGLRKRY